jgi:putative salt-induced outer membrane protein
MQIARDVRAGRRKKSFLTMTCPPALSARTRRNLKICGEDGMLKRSIFATTALLLAFPAAANAEPIPAKVADMIRTAADGGDPGELAATVKIAKKSNPGSADEIDALVARLQADGAARRRAELEQKSFFEGWTGEGQAGFSNATGNTHSTDVALGLSFSRTGLQWDHIFNATADYQRQNGVESQSRYFASYTGHYKFDDRLYGFGLLSWENARFSGFDSRLSEAVGLGYSVLQDPDMTLSVEAGPALRQTHYIVGGSDNRFAGRASVNYLWKILPDLAFTQVLTFYGESRDSTLTSDTGLTANLIGSLAARLSYHVGYESNPPLGLQTTDTLTRLTLVYSF